MNVGSTKSHKIEKFKRRIFLKGSNSPLSYMKDETQNECKSFDIGKRVTLFDLNNLKFKRKFYVIKSPLETSVWQGVLLQSIFL